MIGSRLAHIFNLPALNKKEAKAFLSKVADVYSVEEIEWTYKNHINSFTGKPIIPRYNTNIKTYDIKDYEFRKTKEFLSTFEWRRVRMDALETYGAKCMCCGATKSTGVIMNVDHIKPRKTHPELALTISNLQILCSDCNHGKGNKYSTDWRK